VGYGWVKIGSVYSIEIKGVIGVSEMKKAPSGRFGVTTFNAKECTTDLWKSQEGTEVFAD
jgi:hypothetical protein